MASSDQYDFFVSYARKDNATGWITNFVDELLAEHQQFAAGRELIPFFDKNDIGAGADWQHTLTDGIAHSKLFVAFISPNYFASEWCRKEWRAWIDTEIAKHIFTAGVRPVYIVEVPGLTDGKLSEHDFSRQMAEFLKLSGSDSAKLLAETPPVVKHLRRRQMTHNQPLCDVHSFYTEGVETLRRDDLRQVLKRLAEDLDHHAELLAKADSSKTTIPPYNKNFSGRHDELLQLREWLTKDDRTGVIHGVHGLGGIGKTELALTYAHGYASAYPGGRFLISCDGKSSLREAILTQHDFTSLFADRISDEQRKDPAEYYAAIMRQLGHRLDNLGHVLLLLDNVTDTALLTREQTDVVTKLGPKLHLLATTRLPAPSTHKDNWISLDRLPDEDALELLEKHRPFKDDEDREAAWQIVKRLDGFTLAIELTAAFLAANESTSYAMMSEYLDLDDLEEMAEDDGVELIRHNHERRLSAVLGPVLEGLKPAERRTLEYATFMPPDMVPLPWLLKLVVNDHPELGNIGRLKNPWDELWQKLEKLSLIRRVDDEDGEIRFARVHRLVQDLVWKQMSEDIKDILPVYNLIKDCCDRLEHANNLNYSKWEIYILNYFAVLWAEYDHPEASWLLNFCGIKFMNLADYTTAESLFEKALVINEKKLTPNHSDIATSLNNLAALFQYTYRFEEAERLLRKCLDIEEQIDNNELGLSSKLNNLAVLLSDINKFDEAELLFRKALSAIEKKYGQIHLEYARLLCNFGILMVKLSRFPEAEIYYRRSLSIREQLCGPEHPEVGCSLIGLSSLLCRLNKIEEAEIFARRALAINQSFYGENHPVVASNLEIIAEIQWLANNLPEALMLLRHSLQIREQVYGVDSLVVADNLGAIGLLLFKNDEFEEAEFFIRKSIAINECLCHADDPRVATNLNNLGMLMNRTDRFKEAEVALNRALSINEQCYGLDHADIAPILHNLGILLLDANRLEEAAPLLHRALEINEQHFGYGHPSVLKCLESLNTLKQLIDDSDESCA